MPMLHQLKLFCIIQINNEREDADKSEEERGGARLHQVYKEVPIVGRGVWAEERSRTREEEVLEWHIVED